MALDPRHNTLVEQSARRRLEDLEAEKAALKREIVRLTDWQANEVGRRADLVRALEQVKRFIDEAIRSVL